jgi:outer membrane protein OmpA-like peptidoglycan-associated protein
MKEGYFTSSHDQKICSSSMVPANGLIIHLAPYRLMEDHQLVQQSDSGEHFKIGTQVYEDNSEAIPYLLNIYYDLGRSSVRPEAIPELNRLYFLMLNNPEITVEISSHTDSRGSDQLNKNLSQRRASAIVSWLVSKGINKKRLIARGYGEERLVNECEDGINCNEEQHQLNRRTEFRVLDQQLGQSY